MSEDGLKKWVPEVIEGGREGINCERTELTEEVLFGLSKNITGSDEKNEELKEIFESKYNNFKETGEEDVDLDNFVSKLYVHTREMHSKKWIFERIEREKQRITRDLSFLEEQAKDIGGRQSSYLKNVNVLRKKFVTVATGRKYESPENIAIDLVDPANTELFDKYKTASTMHALDMGKGINKKNIRDADYIARDKSILTGLQTMFLRINLLSTIESERGFEQEGAIRELREFDKAEMALYYNAYSNLKLEE